MLSETAVVVLAAGRGTRMGRPKALMEVGGSQWWLLQRAALSALRARVVWVVSEEVRQAIEREPGSSGMEFAVSDPNAPMFVSALAGIRAAGGRDVFILPVDVPCAAADVFESLCAAASVAIPEYRGEAGHPVFLPSAWIDEALSGAESNSSSMRLDELIRPDAVRVAVDDLRVCMNLNTPADVAALHARGIDEREHLTD